MELETANDRNTPISFSFALPVAGIIEAFKRQDEEAREQARMREQERQNTRIASHADLEKTVAATIKMFKEQALDPATRQDGAQAAIGPQAESEIWPPGRSGVWGHPGASAMRSLAGSAGERQLPCQPGGPGGSGDPQGHQ
jgi:hypothetical protein